MYRKTSVLSFIFPTCPAVLLLSSVAYGSSLEFDWTRSCKAPDHEQLGHELAPGPAAKRPAAADSGETRKLRLIYFLPNDRTFNPDVVDTMKARIPRIRTFFRDQMQSNGKGSKTVEYETDVRHEQGHLLHRGRPRHVQQPGLGQRSGVWRPVGG